MDVASASLRVAETQQPPLSWSTVQRRIRDLAPLEGNPRQLTKKQHADLSRSLAKFNLAEIPAVNTDNTILAGHQRLAILSRLGRGDEAIDVRIPSRPLTEEECKEYNIRSNLNTGEWDFDKLANGFDVDLLVDWGFDKKKLGMRDAEEPVEVAENLPDYLSFIVTAEQRMTIENCLDTCEGTNRTEQLVYLCKTRQ